MSRCPHCSQTPFINLLGRCRDCLHKAFLFALLCWTLWGWLLWDGGQSSSKLAALFGAVSFTLLWLAHLTMMLWYRWRQEDSSAHPPHHH